ncbi:hypothetical protein FIBSPDRAFT_900642 [Athelia psychrophila]|uniref:Uncharacterized protein n=1 Tax=Athelia psychrophila TaxID=1759441 RepID=A0A165Y761_9AGAM|nr:hypothetical protein FIBSPDRAFT_900642 [Fibularhizoctonia sp. CBS 109695]
MVGQSRTPAYEKFCCSSTPFDPLIFLIGTQRFSSTQTFSLSRNNKVVYSSKNHTTVVTTPTMPLFDDIEIRIEAIKAISVSLQQYRRALSLSGLQERIATWIRARKADAYRARHKQRKAEAVNERTAGGTRKVPAQGRLGSKAAVGCTADQICIEVSK